MPILKGHDTIAQAQSGTGKTATFSISVLQGIDLRENKTQALILAPTRELAQQIQKVVRALGDHVRVTSHACVGGTLVRDIFVSYVMEFKLSLVHLVESTI